MNLAGYTHLVPGGPTGHFWLARPARLLATYPQPTFGRRCTATIKFNLECGQ